VSRLNPKEDWITKEVPELRIVPQPLWDRVKARQKAIRKGAAAHLADRPVWDRRRPRYLFSGLMRCGVCGGGYSKISASLFGCSTARNKGTCDNRLNIRRDVLEASVLDGLKSHLMDPDLFKEFAEEFYREVNRLRMAEAAELEGARSELTAVEKKIRRIVQAITDGVPALSLKDELMSLEARQAELKATLADTKAPEPLIHPNLAEIYRRKVADLHVALDEQRTRDQAFELIRSLIDEIVLTPEKGELRIDLKGELAGILNVCAGNKKPAPMIRGGHTQIVMVAGVGFEPTTFRL
jgi:hypothetical protein